LWEASILTVFIHLQSFQKGNNQDHQKHQKQGDQSVTSRGGLPPWL